MSKKKYLTLPDVETIVRYRKLSTAAKLQWLADSTCFFAQAMDKSALKACKLFNTQ